LGNSELKIKRANKMINVVSILFIVYIGIIAVGYAGYEYFSFMGLISRVLTPIVFVIAFYFGGKYLVKNFYSEDN